MSRLATPPAPAAPPVAGKSSNLYAGMPAGAPRPSWQKFSRRLWERASKTLRGQFIVFSILVVVLGVVQAFSISQSFQRSSADMNTIHNGSVPSVDAAQALGQYIDDIDAKSADYLATSGLTALEPCSVPGPNSSVFAATVHNCDDRTINAEIILANQQLFAAAHNVTYPGERTAVERITVGMQEYIADISLLRTEYTLAASKTDPSDPQLQRAYQAYKDANAILQQRIPLALPTTANGTPVFDEQNVPPCQIDNRTLQPLEWAQGSIQDNIDCLSYINKSHLDQAYSDTSGFLGLATWQTLILVLIFCLLIGFIAVRMAAVTHRVVNLGLALALLGAIIFSFATMGLFLNMYGQSNQHDASQHGAFQQMVRDDYDSIYAAALLKRMGTNANADESRWLIALKFNDQAAIAHWQADWNANTRQVHQLMVKAQQNQTWVEEIQPLADMQSTWNQYYAIDGHIRSLALDTTNPQHIANAETLSTGDSNKAFGNFFDAVGRLSQANRGHYEATYQSTQGALMVFIILSALLFPFIGLVAAWGVSRRLRDL